MKQYGYIVGLAPLFSQYFCILYLYTINIIENITPKIRWYTQQNVWQKYKADSFVFLQKYQKG